MIFVAGKDGSMMLMLSSKDVDTLRTGNTLFVDERQTKGETFKRVVLSLHSSDQEALQILQRAGHPVAAKMEEPQPKAGESRCKGCKCITMNVLENHCIVCWSRMAKGAQPVPDGQNRHEQQ